MYKSKKIIQKTLVQNHVRKEKKALLSYVNGQPNSSKKLDLLDQSGILLCCGDYVLI